MYFFFFPRQGLHERHEKSQVKSYKTTDWLYERIVFETAVVGEPRELIPDTVSEECKKQDDLFKPSDSLCSWVYETFYKPRRI